MKKKVLALIMAAAMTFGTMGMSTTAFAADITIAQSEGADIKYVQVIEPDAGSTIGWKFVDGIGEIFVGGWNSIKAEGTADASAEQVLTALKDSLDDYKDEAAAGKMHSNPQFNAALSAVMSSNNVTKSTATGDKFAGTTGLYAISASKTGYAYAPMAAYVNPANDDVTITAKGASNTVQKAIEEDGWSVSAGDEVEYTVTIQYPYYPSSAVSKTFTITDTLTNATFKTDADGKLIPTITGLDNTTTIPGAGLNEDKTQMTLDFSNCYDPTQAGKTMTIKYTAVVGTVTNGNSAENNVNVSFNDPDMNTSYKIKSYTAKFNVVKKDVNNDSEGNPVYLKGAVFTLYRAAVTEDENADAGADIKTVTLENGTAVKVVPLTTATTGENGVGMFDGLDAQKVYYVKETAAPSGYSLNDTAYEVKLSDANKNITPTMNDARDVESYTFENFSDQTVSDTALSSLPSTGGIGTTIFTIGGCVIMIAAAGIFFVSRKKENENK